MKQETMRWQWHQLDHMHIICTSVQTHNSMQHLQHDTYIGLTATFIVNLD